MSEYKLKENGAIKLSNGDFIPFAPGNMDYDIYLAWIAKGNTPEPEFTDAEIKAQKIAKINQDASDQIIAIAPIWRQNNMLARALELSQKGTLSEADTAELDGIKAVWDEIKAIRAASNAAVALLG